MSKSRISLNIHGNNVPDRQRLLDHLNALQPAAVLVLDNYDLVAQINGLLPDTTVIYREFEHERPVHKDVEPQAWLDAHAHQAKDGVALHVLNEPPFNQEVVDWLTELMKLAAPRQIPLIIGNWAVGNPGPDPAKEWPKARAMLELLDQHRDLFILGLHEYAGGVVTSGLYGGYPDNAGVQPGKPGGLNLIPPANWPKDVSGVTRYHMGRFKFLVDYCKSIGLKPPRIILTEHGMDDTSDIKAWEDMLIKTPPYLNIRGWKTLHKQWIVWFGSMAGLGWSPERAYFEQLKWANETIYAQSPVEAQCIFCWGFSSQKWEQFDVAKAGEFQALLENYARTGAPPVAPQPPAPPLILTPFPADNDPRREAIRLTAKGGAANVRANPSINALVLRTFVLEDAHIIPHSLLREDEQFHDQLPKAGFGFWVPVWMGDARGWLRSDAVIESVLSSGKPVEQPNGHPDDARFVEMLVTLITRKRHEWNALGAEITALEAIKQRLEGVEVTL